MLLVVVVGGKSLVMYAAVLIKILPGWWSRCIEKLENQIFFHVKN